MVAAVDIPGAPRSIHGWSECCSQPGSALAGFPLDASADARRAERRLSPISAAAGFATVERGAGWRRRRLAYPGIRDAGGRRLGRLPVDLSRPVAPDQERSDECD